MINVHLISYLKVNLILGTNVIGSKKIDDITSKKYIYIKIYNIKVNIKIIYYNYRVYFVYR